MAVALSIAFAVAACGEDLGEDTIQQLTSGGGGNPTAAPGAVPMPFAPQSLAAPTVISPILLDDQLSAPINIGFTFVFFGNPYTQLLISSNGFLSFNTGLISNGCCSGRVIPAIDT